jgi:hypothetical protein
MQNPKLVTAIGKLAIAGEQAGLQQRADDSTSERWFKGGDLGRTDYVASDGSAESNDAPVSLRALDCLAESSCLSAGTGVKSPCRKHCLWGSI